MTGEKQSSFFKTLGISEDDLLSYLKEHPNDPLVSKLEQLLLNLSAKKQATSLNGVAFVVYMEDGGKNRWNKNIMRY